MSDLITLTRQMHEAKSEIDRAFEVSQAAIYEDAEAYRAAKVATSSAYQAASGPVAERQAIVDQTTADIQYRAKLAEGLRRSAGQAVEAKMKWLSALMTLASLTKAEAQLAKWEPREVESA